jgi:hypothetical protein
MISAPMARLVAVRELIFLDPKSCATSNELSSIYYLLTSSCPRSPVAQSSLEDRRVIIP